MVVAPACSDDDPDAAPPPPTLAVERVPERLHACAGDTPIPRQALLVETATARPRTGDRQTCVVTLAFGEPIPAALDLVVAALTQAAWALSVESRTESLGLVRTSAPRCSTILVVPAEQLGPDAASAAGRPTVALQSFHPCDLPAAPPNP